MATWVSVRECGRQLGCSHEAIRKAIRAGRIGEAAVRRAASGELEAVDVDQARADLVANTDPGQALKNSKAPIAAAGPENGAVDPLLDWHDKGENGRYSCQCVNCGRTFIGHKRRVICPECAPPAGAQQQPGLELGAGASGSPPEDEEREPAPRPGQADPHGYYAHRARREKLQADEAELRHLELLGRVVSKEEVEKEAFESARTLRDQLFNIPDRVATVIAAERDPVRVHEALTREIRRVLHEFNQRQPAPAASGGTA